MRRETTFFVQTRVFPSIFVMPSDSDTSPLKYGCRVAERLCFENVERPEHKYISAQLWYGFGV